MFIYHERPERIAQGCSFVLSHVSDSLTVAHFLWAAWAIRSQLLICLQRSERIAHSRSFDLSEMSEWVNERWANEQIPSPDFLNNWVQRCQKLSYLTWMLVYNCKNLKSSSSKKIQDTITALKFNPPKNDYEKKLDILVREKSITNYYLDTLL